MTDNVPRWAKEKAAKLLNEPIDYTFYRPDHPAAEVFGGYIAEHEKPPVDEDVLAVRRILATRAYYDSRLPPSLSAVIRDRHLLGENDDSITFKKCLEVYREIKNGE